jgi:hypothetical protein
MTDRTSVWEQNFRQPTDADITTELGRLNQAVAQANARTQAAEAKNTQQDTALDGKAPLASPTFTGTPTGPNLAIDPTSPGLITQQHLADRQCCGQWDLTGSALVALGNGTWNLGTQVGTLSSGIGGVTLGAGAQGLFLPRSGYYLVQVDAYATCSAGASVRLIGGLSLNGGNPTLVANVIQNSVTYVPDIHARYNMLAFINSGQLRPTYFMQTNGASFQLRTERLTAVRLC